MGMHAQSFVRWRRSTNASTLLLASSFSWGCQSPPPATAEVVTIAPITAPSSSALDGDVRSDSAVSLRFVAIDDEVDPFRDLAQEPAKLPDGVHFETEVVSVGEASSKERRYARISPTRGESVDAALARTRSFFARAPLPAGESISFQRLSEFDEDRGRTRDTGYRSFILMGAPVITENDVHAATARAPEDQMAAWTVNIELTPSGSERFRKFTADHIGRRMAIVENGMVMSAAVIRSEIAGGRASITIGGGTDDAEAARALAKALGLH